MAIAESVTVVLDAAASVPATLLAGLPIRLAPADPPRMLTFESVSRLSLDSFPAEPAPVVEACRAAAEAGADVLYVSVDDGHGGPPEAADLARVAVEACGKRFAHLATGALLLQAGWPAIVAAEAAAQGAELDAALLAGRAAVGGVGMLGVIDHPEMANPNTTSGLVAPPRGVARWDGPRIVIAPRPQRDAALGMLRDLFTAAVTREAVDGRGILRVAVVHASAAAAAAALALWSERRLQAVEVTSDAVTRHAATRLGPGFVAVSWIWRPGPQAVRRFTD